MCQVAAVVLRNIYVEFLLSGFNLEGNARWQPRYPTTELEADPEAAAGSPYVYAGAYGADRGGSGSPRRSRQWSRWNNRQWWRAEMRTLGVADQPLTLRNLADRIAALEEDAAWWRGWWQRAEALWQTLEGLGDVLTQWLRRVRQGAGVDSVAMQPGFYPPARAMS